MAFSKPGRVLRTRSVIGSAIERHRTEGGLRIEGCAQRCHVSYHTWSRWEAGTHSVPAELLPRIAEILEVSVLDLFTVKRAAAATRRAA